MKRSRWLPCSLPPIRCPAARPARCPRGCVAARGSAGRRRGFHGAGVPWLMPPLCPWCRSRCSGGRMALPLSCQGREAPLEQRERCARLLVRYPACVRLCKPQLGLSVSENLTTRRGGGTAAFTSFVEQAALVLGAGLHLSCGRFVPGRENRLFQVQCTHFLSSFVKSQTVNI